MPLKMNSHIRPVVCLDKDTNEELEVYSSAAEGGRWLNKGSPTEIMDVCEKRKNRVTAYGFK